MQFISGISADLQPELMTGVARYRHKVFVETLGWQLQCEHGLEYDQFDRDDTVYVVAKNEADEVVGIARLLPTIRPYLLGEVFPQLLHGLPMPSSPDVWELSRFAAQDFNAPTSTALDQFSSPIAVGLLQAAQACALAHGAKRFITVSPLGVERLLRRAGFQAHRLAPPVIVNGHPIFACSIHKSFVRRSGGDSNANFKGGSHSNDTHESSADPDAQLYCKRRQHQSPALHGPHPY